MNLNKTSAAEKLAGIIKKALGDATKSHFIKEKIANCPLKIETTTDEQIDEKYLINYGGDDQNINSLTELDIAERAKDRKTHQEEKRQSNIENITAFASEELKEDPSVTNEPLDDDWTTRFFNISEDISNENMQALWGRILAGEIRAPKSYSLRTLEIIRNLTSEEAKIFMKIANFTIKSHGNYVIYKAEEDKPFHFQWNEIALLVELGIIQPGDMTSLQFHPAPNIVKQHFILGNLIVITEKEVNTPLITIPVYVFTKVGIELLKLVNITSDFEYAKSFAKKMTQKGLKVEYSNLIKIEGEIVHYQQPLRQFID